MNQVQVFGFISRTESKLVMRLEAMPETGNKIDQCVEALCSQGCSRVSGFIVGLRAGEEIPEAAGLSRQERQRVLEELVSIMAAYDGSCES